TLVLAGYTPTLMEYAAQLGVRMSIGGDVIERASLPGGPAGAPPAGGQLSVPVHTRVRVEPASDARPLLISDDGRIVALRKAYRRGTVIVLSTPLPLSNQGLRDRDTAQFVYREVVVQVAALSSA